MEEDVGKIWHRWVTGVAGREFPEAAVPLEQIQAQAAVVFRALGGDGGLRLANSSATQNQARRSVLARVAGINRTVDYAWREQEMLRLPLRLACFPSAELNRELYLWLAALATAPSYSGLDWISRSQAQVFDVLERCPGLQSRYDRLHQALLAQRPLLKALNAEECAAELSVRQALALKFTEDKSIPFVGLQAVPLWLHPEPPSVAADQPSGEDNPERSGSGSKKEDDRRRSSERVDMPDGKNGLLSFRLESMFSWTDYIKVDRTTDDADEDTARDAANDMDKMSVARDSTPVATKLRFDLDLPPEDNDDLILGEGISLPEWDWKKQQLLDDHCRIQLMIAREAVPCELPVNLRRQAQRLRREFEGLRPARRWLGRQVEGQEVDLESYIGHCTAKTSGRQSHAERLYRHCVPQERSLSCLLLADLSLSTDSYVNDDSRVIDVIRDGLFLFSEALSSGGDRFALHGFSSRRRNHVRYHTIKGFDEKYSAEVRGRIDAIKPGYYTRMGAALRQASSQLEAESSDRKLLLLLTDGKPNDLDKYEGRYGIEDTRMAVRELHQKGITPFCVTVDEKAPEYLPYIFGQNSFMVVANAEQLPTRLPKLYAQLVAH